MAITQAMCSSFRAQVMLGVHDFRPDAQTGADDFYIALYTSAATIDATTTQYSATNEASGTGYTAGGMLLSNQGVTTTGGGASTGTGHTDFADVTWPSSTITARGALIYNSTRSANDNADAALTNPACIVLDFGSDKSSTDGNFTIIFPTADSSNAIIRIA